MAVASLTQLESFILADRHVIQREQISLVFAMTNQVTLVRFQGIYHLNISLATKGNQVSMCRIFIQPLLPLLPHIKGNEHVKTLILIELIYNGTCQYSDVVIVTHQLKWIVRVFNKEIAIRYALSRSSIQSECTIRTIAQRCRRIVRDC